MATFAKFTEEWFQKCYQKLLKKSKVLCSSTFTLQSMITINIGLLQDKIIKPFQSTHTEFIDYAVLAETKISSSLRRRQTIFCEGASPPSPPSESKLRGEVSNTVIVAANDTVIHKTNSVTINICINGCGWLQPRHLHMMLIFSTHDAQMRRCFHHCNHGRSHPFHRLCWHTRLHH